MFNAIPTKSPSRASLISIADSNNSRALPIKFKMNSPTNSEKKQSIKEEYKRVANVCKFEDYKGKVKEMVDKRDYVSNSEHSDKELNLDAIGEEDKADKSEDEEFNIKSLQMQSKG